MIGLLLTLAIGLYGICQVLLKLGLTKIGPISWDRAIRGELFLDALGSPAIILGFLTGIIGTTLYLWILSKAPLTLVFPFVSLVFPLVMVLGWALLGEPLTWRSVAGMVLLVAGLYFIASGRIA